MMDSSHERQSMGSSAGVCNGVGQPGTAAAERVPGCGEPDSPRTPANAAAPVGSGALHACRDRQATRTQSSGEGRLCGQTRHHSRLVSAAYRPQVRWFAIPYLSWPTPYQSRDRGSGGSLRPRELGLGLRPHCRRAGEPRPSCFGPDCRQHPAPPRHRTGSQRSQTTTWKEFIRRHMDVLAGTDFFTVEVLTWRGLVTYYVLFFLHLETRRVSLAGITRHPTEEWMTQMARNAVDEESGYLHRHRYVLHDRDTKI